MIDGRGGGGGGGVIDRGGGGGGAGAASTAAGGRGVDAFASTALSDGVTLHDAAMIGSIGASKRTLRSAA